MSRTEVLYLRRMIRQQHPNLNHSRRKLIEKACIEREKQQRASKYPPIPTVRLDADEVWKNGRRRLNRRTGEFSGVDHD